MLLSVVIRQQPVTAYQLFKVFEESPVSSLNASKGQVYPAVRRLKARGLLSARRVAGDARKSEELHATPAGEAAVKLWIAAISDDHIALDDPLRSRMLSLDLLTREERLEWVAQAKGLVRDRQQRLEDYNKSVSVPYQTIAYRSVVDVLQAKMEWLDELLYLVAGRK